MCLLGAAWGARLGGPEKASSHRPAILGDPGMAPPYVSEPRGRAASHRFWSEHSRGTQLFPTHTITRAHAGARPHTHACTCALTHITGATINHLHVS